ncbi:YopX family protein [Enterococcus mediterraneensis]|uniref:YopX family protein n=1 Tax=Enterococcus mediterraneensis TaxID=2364791 RepID=UPI000F063F48|nr:YopX family protein [Enterococcus mediterraneensis]
MVPKYRCWDEPNKIMRFNDEIVIWNDQVYINEKKELDSRIKGYSCLSEHLMQSTGLKDKSGVEIYEGDILVYTSKSINYGDAYYHSYVEVFRNQSGAYRIRGEHIYETELYSNRNSLTVVGDIYSSPELLKKERFMTSTADPGLEVSE